MPLPAFAREHFCLTCADLRLISDTADASMLPLALFGMARHKLLQQDEDVIGCLPGFAGDDVASLLCQRTPMGAVQPQHLCLQSMRRELHLHPKVWPLDQGGGKKPGHSQLGSSNCLSVQHRKASESAQSQVYDKEAGVQCPIGQGPSTHLLLSCSFRTACGLQILCSSSGDVNKHLSAR